MSAESSLTPLVPRILGQHLHQLPALDAKPMSGQGLDCVQDEKGLHKSQRLGEVPLTNDIAAKIVPF